VGDSLPAPGRRVGWLGGSFDPVHDGHLAIARRAAEHLGLDYVLLVPAPRPPHKPDKILAPAEVRLALLESATAGDPRLLPCDIELERDGPSYSIDTAHALKEWLGSGVELFYIIGADTLADLPNWYRIADLCEAVTFCAVTRPGTELDPSPMERVVGPSAAARIREHLLEMEPHPASSTAIREALSRGERPEHVPEVVLQEIARRGLYGAGGASSSETSGIGGTKP
jgi:nicotinate-nucleotide adenylyltransferase